MRWTDKTVSMDLVDAEEFEFDTATVTVSENGIRVEYKDSEDVARILEEHGEDALLQAVRWRHVKEVELTENDLFYPHIDVTFTADQDMKYGLPRRKRIYVREDENDRLEDCYKTIQRFWNKHNQSKATPETTEPPLPEEEPTEEVELRDPAATAEEPAEDETVESDEQHEPAEQERAPSRSVDDAKADFKEEMERAQQLLDEMRDDRQDTTEEKREQGRKEYKRIQSRPMDDDADDSTAAADNAVKVEEEGTEDAEREERSKDTPEQRKPRAEREREQAGEQPDDVDDVVDAYLDEDEDE